MDFAIGDNFRLIGRQNVFQVVRVFLAAGFIPSIVGVSADGKFQTCARVLDVEKA